MGVEGAVEGSLEASEGEEEPELTESAANEAEGEHIWLFARDDVENHWRDSETGLAFYRK